MGRCPTAIAAAHVQGFTLISKSRFRVQDITHVYGRICLVPVGSPDVSRASVCIWTGVLPNVLDAAIESDIMTQCSRKVRALADITTEIQMPTQLSTDMPYRQPSSLSFCTQTRAVYICPYLPLSRISLPHISLLPTAQHEQSPN